MIALSLDPDDYKPYSLRRGGATFLFQTRGDLLATIVRGRWANSPTARIYINEALALVTASAPLSPAIAAHASAFRALFRAA